MRKPHLSLSSLGQPSYAVELDILRANGRRMHSLALGVLKPVLLKHAPVADLLVEELVKIETNHLGFLADTEVHEGDVLEDVQQSAGHDEGVRGDSADFSQLLSDLNAISVDGAGVLGGAVES